MGKYAKGRFHSTIPYDQRRKRPPEPMCPVCRSSGVVRDPENPRAWLRCTACGKTPRQHGVKKALAKQDALEARMRDVRKGNW
jgi:ribosomal protein L37AE/L43A